MPHEFFTIQYGVSPARRVGGVGGQLQRQWQWQLQLQLQLLGGGGSCSGRWEGRCSCRGEVLQTQYGVSPAGGRRGRSCRGEGVREGKGWGRGDDIICQLVHPTRI